MRSPDRLLSPVASASVTMRPVPAAPVADPDFLRDVLAGLSSSPKSLPCKYFYDQRGSQLFDRICELPEYYPTRTELAIMRRHGGDMAATLGSDVQLVEYGSGSSLKTRLLLNAIDKLDSYVPLDISREHLMKSAAELSREYPYVKVQPVCADYTKSFFLPRATSSRARRVIYFPGSTIGNFQPEEAQQFLRRAAEAAGAGGGLLIGVDLQKPAAVLEPAYDDAQGVTAEFNLNLLRRVNRELNADLPVQDFEHRAIYNHEHGRVEMHLVARRDLLVWVDGHRFPFRAGESIHTENSYKYTLESFTELARKAGWHHRQTWLDDRCYFSVQYLET